MKLVLASFCVDAHFWVKPEISGVQGAAGQSIGGQASKVHRGKQGRALGGSRAKFRSQQVRAQEVRRAQYVGGEQGRRSHYIGITAENITWGHK